MTKPTNLNDTEIMSAKDAAPRLGKAPDYIRSALRARPERFPEGTVRLFGRQLVVVTREGMEAVTDHKEIASND